MKLKKKLLAAVLTLAMALTVTIPSLSSAAEEPKTFSKSLIFVALGEGVALYGFLISFMILNALG